MNKSERRTLEYRTGDRQPRTPYCTGCGTIFNKHHQLFNHRNTMRCGGRFLPEDERSLYDKAKLYGEAMMAAEKAGEDDAYRLYFHNRGDCLSRAYILRKRRLDKGIQDAA